MRAEFYRPEDPDVVVGAAQWDGRRVRMEVQDEDVRAALARVFRPSPVVLEDPSLRPPGASGETVVEPGDLEWFRVAALVRGGREGFGVRFVSDSPGGWDPAGAYRPMHAWLARKEAGS